MGLAGFNRMRRERKPVEMIEAERAEENLKYLHGRSVERQAQHAANKERVEEIREAEAAASVRIGEKVLIGQGLDPVTGEATGAADQSGFTIDEPLRRDHAAEIAGRNLQGVQETKTPPERLDERIPSHETEAEKLVPHLVVSQPGPTAEMVEAARMEREDPASAPGARGPTADAEDASEAGRTVGIPEDWDTHPAEARKAMATSIVGHDVLTVREGDPIIREEVARRALVVAEAVPDADETEVEQE